jgi:tetratricopeptide (TPR) repeat protein
VGDLQGRPEYANLNDKEGALASEQKAVALLEPLAQSSPRDGELRHLLIVAVARRGAVQEFQPGGQNAMRADFQRSLALAERFASNEPANWQAKRDLALTQDLNGNHTRALQLMDSVVTAGPDTPQDRFERAFYEWRVGQDSQAGRADALQHYQKSVTELEALSRESPANAQYRRQLAVTLSAQSSLLQQMNRDYDAIDSARHALAIQEQLAASDPKNTAFRLDVTGLQQTVGRMLVEAGKRGEAMDLYRQALAVTEKLVAEQPRNPDFRYQRALCNQSLATISAYRQAEAELAELRSQFPDRLVYRRELVRSRVYLAYAIFQHTDRPGGIAMGRLAVEEGDALLAAPGASDDDRDVAAYAFRCLARFFATTGRFQEALAEVRKALAIEEPLVARHPGNKEYLANYAFMCIDAAYGFNTSRDWASVVEYGSKALRYLDAKQVVASGDSDQISGLTLALEYIALAYDRQGDHIHAAESDQRAVEIQEKFAALDPSDASRANNYVSALRYLATAHRNTGDRQGALDSYRRARAVLDKFDPRKMTALSQRQNLANGYLNLSSSFAAIDEDAEALASARIALQLFDAIYQADPKSKSGLIAAGQALAAALERSGDLREAIEQDRNALDLELKSAASGHGAATITRAIAGLEARAGDKAAAERDFRKAVEFHLQAFARAEKHWNTDRKDTTSLGTMVTEEREVADLLERLGQPEEALAYCSKALEHARLQFDANPKESTAINNLQETTHAVDRFEWERAGEKGHFPPGIPDYLWSSTGIATVKERTMADVRASVAWSYLHLGLFGDDGDPVRIRRALLQGLEIHQALLREEPQYETNATYAVQQALQRLADSSMLMARRTSGEERRRNLLEARDYLVRAKTFVKDAEAKRKLVEKMANVPGQIAVKLATVEAWLQEPGQVTAIH